MDFIFNFDISKIFLTSMELIGVEKACMLLKEINPLANGIYEEPEQYLPIAFRNCVIVKILDKARTVQKIYTDVQFIEEWKKKRFISLGHDMPGDLFVLELEQEITRIGFRF